jgi:hypothetical protein
MLAVWRAGKGLVRASAVRTSALPPAFPDGCPGEEPGLGSFPSDAPVNHSACGVVGAAAVTPRIGTHHNGG